MSTRYEIKLPQFEGPFDLLLFFIERDELDIYDIPISKLTDDFLDYIHQAEQMDIELASEFILVAATLMRIKARLLLPRKELDEEGNEIDPREELVQKLMEYRQFKAVIDELKVLEEQRLLHYKRGNIEKDLKHISRAMADGEADLQTLTLFKLMNSFQKVLQRMEDRNNQPEHKIVKYPYTINDQKTFLLTTLNREDRTGFEDLFAVCENRVHAIFTFLAMLELIQLSKLTITMGQGKNNFWLQLS